jgi:hypothetical protein
MSKSTYDRTVERTCHAAIISSSDMLLALKIRNELLDSLDICDATRAHILQQHSIMTNIYDFRLEFRSYLSSLAEMTSNHINQANITGPNLGIIKTILFDAFKHHQSTIR